MTAADIFAVLIALSLPWSTSLVAIFAAVLAGGGRADGRLQGFLDRSEAADLLVADRAVCAGAGRHAVVGRAVGGAPSMRLARVTKLLVLPLLFYHFQRSTRGMWVLLAFLISCTLLMAVSWLVLFEPGSLSSNGDAERGIFVKDYINQSQEFALCAVALALSRHHAAARQRRSGRRCLLMARRAELRRSTWCSSSCRARRWSRCRSCSRCSRWCI